MFEPLPEYDCCGCMACVNACPKDIIAINKDKLGFSYPYLQSPGQCINCNRCNVVCPNKKTIEYSLNVGEVICAYNKNTDERLYSSSGGIFPLLCKNVISQGGICYGVAFKDDFQTEFIRIHNNEDLKTIFSSKYLEAEKGLIYRKVKQDLIEGKIVLFSGSPCQVYGLKGFLQKDYTNLLLVDLFCYGIPSPVIWDRWIQYIAAGRNPVFVDFRDKTYGWDNYSLRIVFSDGTSYCEPKAHDKYIATFSKGAFIRKSCYNCHLKAFPRVSDITLGDFQELKEIYPEENPHAGWSMIKIHTVKGQAVFEEIKNDVEFHIVTGEVIDSVHPGIGSPSQIHPNRARLEEHIDDMSIEKLLTKYASLTTEMKFEQFFSKIKHKTKVALQQIGIIH